MHSGPFRALIAVACAASLACSSALVAGAASAAPSVGPQSAAVDAADRVAVPRADWYTCFGGDHGAQCATVEVPLDYDRPRGATTTIAVVRLRTADPKRKIGSIFVNPGGPGGSGVEMALGAPGFLSAELLERFDVVGVDPRGVNFSDNVRCFRNAGEQEQALAGLLSVAFPFTESEESAAVRSAERMGRACSTTGRPLSGSMSTAEVARDMDLVRRLVGDQRLTYLGFSYGSYLGQVYANLFPSRVRALVIDGVLDPLAWAGTSRTASVPVTDRLRSADGAWKALSEILRRCDVAGADACPIAPGKQTLDDVVTALRDKPLVIDVEGITFELSYATFVGILLSELYAPQGWQYVVSDIGFVRDLLAGGSTSEERAAAASGLRAAMHRSLLATGFEFPYDNGFEAFASVLCTDSRNPASARRWPAVAPASDARAPLFGRAWLWGSAQCAERTWTVRDEDSYRGPFNARTAAPVLVVGNYWDPATNYAGAVRASRLLPNSRLLSSDSWGHTAYGTSACVTQAVESYLLDGSLPAKQTVCVGDEQPFQPSQRRGGEVRRAPITPFVPGGVVTES